MDNKVEAQSAPTSPHPAQPLQRVSAASKVFGIFELTEKILLELRSRDILLIANTTAEIRNVVEHSGRILNRFTNKDLNPHLSWATNIDPSNLCPFAVAFDCCNTSAPLHKHVEMKVFVSRKGDYEAVAVLDPRLSERIKVIDGSRTKIRWVQVYGSEWKVVILDNDSGYKALTCLDPGSQVSPGLAKQYLLRYHGER